MKIQYVSDLHLEFSLNRDFLRANPIKPEGEILLLAGDIVPFAIMRKHDDFFSYLSDNFKNTYWIPGNHEYYNYDVAEKSEILFEQIKSNVSLVNNITIVQDNVKFIFSTLWSKINPNNQFQIESSLSDFHVIKYKENLFNSNHYNQFHNNCLNFIKKELNDTDNNKNVVVTHHIPTFMNYPEKYKGDIMNEAFAVELFDFIETKGPDYWIYGHNHYNQADFEIGSTKMKTNQLGYVKYNEHLTFMNNISFQI